MDPILIFICIIVGGILTSIGVHLMPVGGAPAAMGTATGVATGVNMLSTGAAMTGLFTASTVAMVTSNIWLVSLSGAVGSMLMLSVYYAKWYFDIYTRDGDRACIWKSNERSDYWS